MSTRPAIGSYQCLFRAGGAAAILHDSSGDRLSELLQLRAQLHKQQADVTKEIRNERRKRQRLLSKAEECSLDDLLRVAATKIKK